MLLVRRPEVADRGVDTAAAPRDLHVVETRGTHLLFVLPRPAEDAVGVRVDEPWREDTIPAVDLTGARKSRSQRGDVVDSGDRCASRGNCRTGANPASSISEPRRARPAPAQVTICAALTKRNVPPADARS